jgi:hypothetical protein
MSYFYYFVPKSIVVVTQRAKQHYFGTKQNHKIKVYSDPLVCRRTVGGHPCPGRVGQGWTSIEPLNQEARFKRKYCPICVKKPLHLATVQVLSQIHHFSARTISFVPNL